jgi:hypothetical protein
MGVQPIAVPPGLATVINAASDKSNVDFDYMLQTAMRESSLNPEAKAPTSSAVGLFQFLESTWLQVMKEQGPRLGYQQYADAIAKTSDGDYVIKDKDLRAKILKLREDPQIAADLAAAFTQANGEYLTQKFGRMPSPGELYIAHFLGAQGAEKFFRAGLADADQTASKLFAKQAKANPSLFYDGKHARTIREVYRALVAQHTGGAPVVTPPTQVPTDDPKFLAQAMVAESNTRWSTEAVPSRFDQADMSFTALFSTEAAYAGRPLVPGSAPLAAIEAAAGDVAPLPGVAPNTPSWLDTHYRRLPAPEPLIPTVDPPLAGDLPLALVEPEVAVETASADSTIPRARVLMTSLGTGEGSTPFFTQLLAQPTEP